MNPGSIVSCRNREWVMMPADQPDLLLLRPLTGAVDNIVAVHKRLADLLVHTFTAENIAPSEFPLPKPEDLSDAASAQLLWQATRLTLREGAAPFRSLGRISIRPRTYQFVPLLMALRLDPVRLLIADDVGVGKTIEAVLIARELLDRGEIKRMCVICPPYLCEQWQKELAEKFNLDAVVVHSGTVGRLERGKVGAGSIYKSYSVLVVSIDFVKSGRNQHLFLMDCPEFVIVDEAHGAAVADPANANQQQRHHLLSELAMNKKQRHMVLLTATPHSGVAGAFRSLLGLLCPDFANYDPGTLSEAQRIELARHFVQRTRKDIETEWKDEQPFPIREPLDHPYPLSESYAKLFKDTYAFCSEIVIEGQGLSLRQKRVRYWGALALLRCVMSSPEAAIAAFESRHRKLPAEDGEPDFSASVFESAEDRTDDSTPTAPVEAAAAELPESGRGKLRTLAALAKSLRHSREDSKLAACIDLSAKLLRDGFCPIIWCRYVATANYVGKGIVDALSAKFKGLQVLAITGMIGDDERRERIDALKFDGPRVLVATDCLSEGVNLQDKFDAAVHYDLPWNPNRLEQREGRVDRFGQKSKTVKTIRMFSPNSAVDGVLLEVLLNKAREIHKALGTHVPVPEESETVTQAVLNALFLRGRRDEAQSLFDFGDGPDVAAFHRKWDAEAARERQNRTRFAQRALKPQEVRRELEATDAVLGDPDAVRQFLLEAAQRVGLALSKDAKFTDVFHIQVGNAARAALPDAVAYALPPRTKSEVWRVSFTSPLPNGADEYLGRNHAFIAALAQYLLEDALTQSSRAKAARCGVMRTRAVEKLTTLLLLRARYLISTPDRPLTLAEEVQVAAYHGSAGKPDWLADAEALKLLATAQPHANMGMSEKRELTTVALNGWKTLLPALAERMEARADALNESHRRVRQAVALKVRNVAVTPQVPPDLLGLLILQPMVTA